MIRKRPTSPHLTVYSPMITSMSSIVGRFAGIGLYVISSFVVLAMAFAIQNKQNVGILLEYVNAFYNRGLLLLILTYILTTTSLFVFFFYLSAIVRHLIWDFGCCLDLGISKIMGYLMFIVSLLLSIVTTIYIFS